VYRIEIEAEAEAEKALRRLPRNMAKQIRSKLLAVAADPFARNPNVKKFTGEKAIDCVLATGGRCTRSMPVTR
jgi:mRNA-degrading endonuclease RelE of RelBE toxin-antitoxin system